MPTLTETRRLLNRVAFLATVPGPLKDRLAGIARTTHYSAGDAVFRRGDLGEGMLLILDGVVRLHLFSAAGREVTLGWIGRGEPVGEISLVDGGPRSADATALTPVSALLLRHADVAEMITQDVELAAALLRTLAARLRRTTDQVEAVALRALPQRLAGALLRLADADPAGLVRLPQGQIASLVAATRPKVNAALSDLRARGFVTPSRAGLRLADPEGLRLLADAE